MAKTAAPKPPRLTKKELVEDRMCLRSAKLVDEVYDLAKRQMASEDRRETNLSAKAVSLLSVTGLSLTVAFTFGGVLLQRPAYLAALGPWRTPLVVVPYAFALLSGMAASWYALRSLKVRPDYREVSEGDVFGGELASADENGEQGLAAYRRFLSVHFWLIYQNNSDIHETKATQVQRGQRFFFAFLFLLLPIGVAMTYSLSVADESPATPPPVTSAIRAEESKPVAPPAPAPTTQPPKPLPTRVPSSGELVQGHTDLGEQFVPPAKRKK